MLSCRPLVPGRAYHYVHRTAQYDPRAQDHKHESTTPAPVDTGGQAARGFAEIQALVPGEFVQAPGERTEVLFEKPAAGILQ